MYYDDHEISWPDLKRAFHNWLDAGRPNHVGIDGENHSSKWLLNEVFVSGESDAALPPKVCDELGLAKGSTYEAAVDLLTENESQVTPEMMKESMSPDSIDFRWTEDEAVISFEKKDHVVRICLSGKQAAELLSHLIIFHDVYVSDGCGGRWMVPGVEYVDDDGSVFLASFSMDDEDEWTDCDEESEECKENEVTS